MELKIIEDKKNILKVQIEGEDDTLMNILAEELNNSKNVDITGYKREHPLIKRVLLTIKGTEPKKELFEAIKRIKKTNSDFKKVIANIK